MTRWIGLTEHMLSLINRLNSTGYATLEYMKISRIIQRLLLAAFALSISHASIAFDIAGLKIGDTVDDFQSLESPAKEFLTVTHDPDGNIVRVFYRQEGLPNDEKTQAKLVNRICNKYGFKLSC